MTVTNFGELKQAIENELRMDDITNEIPRFIRQGEQRLYQKLRVRFMETNVNITTTIAQRADTLPSRFRQARSLYVAGTPNVRLEFRTPVEYWSVYGSLPTAPPTVYTIEAENFLWGPVPDAAETITVLYYKEPVALSADADTNGLFTLDFQLLMYSALIASAPFLKNDARVIVWTQLYEDCLRNTMEADRRDRYSGDVIIPERAAQLT